MATARAISLADALSSAVSAAALSASASHGKRFFGKTIAFGNPELLGIRSGFHDLGLVYSKAKRWYPIRLDDGLRRVESVG